MAMAATITIVELENEPVPVGELDPDQIHVPGVYVDRLISIPEDDGGNPDPLLPDPRIRPTPPFA